MKTLTNYLKKAVVEMMILKILSEGDKYGYQITQELKLRSKGRFTLLEGSMYPILYRLSDGSYISFYEQKVGVRQKRVYYHIEPLGLERLSAMLTEYHRSIGVIDFLLNSKEGDCYESE